MSLLEMSLRGGVLILVIALVRALTLHRLPKRTFLLLWALAALQLSLPVSLPARFSVYTLVTQLAFVSTGKMISGTPLTGTTLLPGTVSLPENADGALPLPVAAASSGVSVWMVLWLAGAVLCAALLLLAYGKCRREFRTSLPVESEAVKQWLCAHPLRRSVQVRQSELVSAPLTYGIFRPVILLPKTMDWEDTSTLSYVLEHECIHIRRLDALTKPLLLAIFCVHWFNPAVWLMVLLANRDLELSCDEALLRRRGLDAKAEYAKALLSLEVQRSKYTPFYSSFSKNEMEERMKAMLKMKKSTRFAAMLACVLVLVIAASFCTSAWQNKEVQENASLQISNPQTDEEPTQLAGFLKEADNGKLVIVVTEYITDEDTERIAQLGLTEEDMPDGYYFYTEDTNAITLQYDDNTQFTFIDWYNDFTASGSDRNYTTRDFSQFQQYLNTYEDGQPKMPFFFTVQNNVVQLVLEKPFM